MKAGSVCLLEFKTDQLTNISLNKLPAMQKQNQNSHHENGKNKSTEERKLTEKQWQYRASLTANREKRNLERLKLGQPNILHHIHTMLTSLSTRFRIGVEQDCNLSTPSYYRNMKKLIAIKVVNGEESGIIQDFSKADKHMIRKNLDEIVAYVNNYHADFMRDERNY